MIEDVDWEKKLGDALERRSPDILYTQRASFAQQLPFPSISVRKLSA